MNKNEPDSGFSNGIGDDRQIEIYWTHEDDFPQHGAVSLVLHFSKRQSTSLRITKAEARSALAQLQKLLKDDE